MSKEQRLADNVGKGLAHLQHAVDRCYEWGFRKLKEVGSEPKIIDAPQEEGIKANAKRLGRKAAGFLGTTGDAFYRTYEELKRKGK